MEPAQSIDLNLGEKLKDKGYRQRFFRAQDSAKIAEQLIALRKRRGLNQTQTADLSGTKQPAISRAEQADYQNRKLETLRAIVEALDGRLRVIIEPAEDVLKEYIGEPKAAREPITTNTEQQSRADLPPAVVSIGLARAAYRFTAPSASFTYFLDAGAASAHAVGDIIVAGVALVNGFTGIHETTDTASTLVNTPPSVSGFVNLVDLY